MCLISAGTVEIVSCLFLGVCACGVMMSLYLSLCPRLLTVRAVFVAVGKYKQNEKIKKHTGDDRMPPCIAHNEHERQYCG